MTYWIRRGVSRLFRLAVRRPEQAGDEMDAELRFHLEARIEHLMARGKTREQARAEALRRLGRDYPSVRATLRASAERRERRLRLLEWLADLKLDLGYAARGLRQRPGFTLLAVATLAIGIGATTAIWSAVNALLLRPLPYQAPERLMQLHLVVPPRAADGQTEPMEMVWSHPKYLAFQDVQREFSDLALFSRQMFTLTGGSGDAERVVGESVSASYLKTLGVSPLYGRSFSDEEGAIAGGGSRRVAIIGAGLWQRRFNADPAIIGKTLTIARESYEIVGVAPASFPGLTGQAELWIPFAAVNRAEDLAQAYSHMFYLVGRLRDGITPEQAAAATVLHGRRINERYRPDAGFAGETAPWSAKAVTLNEARVSPVMRRSLLILFGAVAFVLLIACANLANLLLGRAATRQREIGVRLALGAGRGRLVRLLLAESALLAVLGGAASLLVTWWGVSALARMNPADTLRVQGLAGLGAVEFASIQLDAAALRFALLVTFLVGGLFGLVPALAASRQGLTEALKNGQQKPGGLRGVNSRRALVVLELALALVLLAGSGVMLRSLGNLLRVNPGFDSEQVLTFRTNIPQGTRSRDSLPGFYEQLLTRLAALPGVSGAAVGDCPPLSGGCNATQMEIMDRPRAPGTQDPDVGIHWVSPEWFKLLGVPLVRGRLLEPSDRLGAPKAVVISQSTAQRVFPNQDPIGRRVGLGQGGFHDGTVIVGVVGDVRFGMIDDAPGLEAYVSYLQSPQSRMLLYVRTQGDPLAVVGPARGVLRELLPEAAVWDVQTMEERVARASAQPRFAAGLLALFSAVALALAAIGIYGVMSFAVTQRRRELGIRMALGADQRRILGMVLQEGMVLWLIGAVIGLAGAFAVTRVLRGLLYGVTPSDPVTFVAMLLVLAAAAVLASWLPARRAAGVDPTVTLRAE